MTRKPTLQKSHGIGIGWCFGSRQDHAGSIVLVGVQYVTVDRKEGEHQNERYPLVAVGATLKSGEGDGESGCLSEQPDVEFDARVAGRRLPKGTLDQCPIALVEFKRRSGTGVSTSLGFFPCTANRVSG